MIVFFQSQCTSLCSILLYSRRLSMYKDRQTLEMRIRTRLLDRGGCKPREVAFVSPQRAIERSAVRFAAQAYVLISAKVRITLLYKKQIILARQRPEGYATFSIHSLCLAMRPYHFVRSHYSNFGICNCKLSSAKIVRCLTIHLALAKCWAIFCENPILEETIYLQCFCNVSLYWNCSNIKRVLFHSIQIHSQIFLDFYTSANKVSMHLILKNSIAYWCEQNSNGL